MGFVENGLFLNIDIEPLGTFFCQGHMVAYLALQAHVGDQTMPGLGVDARHVARVGVAVGVAVLHIEKQHELVSVGNGGHG